MRGRLGDEARLRHILEAIVQIESYVHSKTLPEFKENSMMRFACIKQLEIIGEASNRLSENLREVFSEVE